MSDLVGNPEDPFSHNEAHMISTFAMTVKQSQANSLIVDSGFDDCRTFYLNFLIHVI